MLSAVPSSSADEGRRRSFRRGSPSIRAAVPSLSEGSTGICTGLCARSYRFSGSRCTGRPPAGTRGHVVAKAFASVFAPLPWMRIAWTCSRRSARSGLRKPNRPDASIASPPAPLRNRASHEQLSSVAEASGSKSSGSRADHRRPVVQPPGVAVPVTWTARHGWLRAFGDGLPSRLRAAAFGRDVPQQPPMI